MDTSEYKVNVSLKNLISFINFCIYVHMHVRWQGERQRLYFFPLSIPNKWARELYTGGAGPSLNSYVILFSNMQSSCVPSVVRWV